MIGIHPDNQAPELKHYNVYTSDLVLRRAVERGDRNVDAVLVNVQIDVQSARFVHGPSSSQLRNDVTGLRSGALV